VLPVFISGAQVRYRAMDSRTFISGRIREAANCRFFTHRPKITIFAPPGRLVAPIQVKFGTAEGHMGPLGRAIFRANWFTGVGMRPKKIENFHFWQRVAQQARTL